MSLQLLNRLSKHSFSKMAVRSMSGTKGFSELQNIINGKRCSPKNSTASFDNINPATGAVVGKFGRSNKDDVNQAVQNCLEAYEDWKESTSSERSAILRKAAIIVEENKDDIAVMETIDTGTVIYFLTIFINYLKARICLFLHITLCIIFLMKVQPCLFIYLL